MRYFTPRPVHHRLGLACLGVGLQEGALPPVGPRVLDHHVAVVISAGRGWFRTGAAPGGADDRTASSADSANSANSCTANGEAAGALDVIAPALLWLTPGVPHHYGPDPDEGWDEAFVDFTGPAVDAYTELGCIEPERPVVPLTDTGPARTAIGRIARAARHGNPLLELESAAAVHELLVALRRARADTAPDGTPVLQALARDAFLPLSVSAHASRLGLTAAELRTAVRLSAGCSPKDYLLGIRLGRAKELLAGTTLPVASVARRVGYDDPAYFSRLFTRRVGTPPVRFRERQGRAVPGGWSDRVPPPDRPPTITPVDVPQ
ncbi:AraC family transcriptional regulator [Streptomyces armeniacus]|uniref:AraC family transcriptional regulator n=1 Tax=Streptomyces armeniacus TaxID=83291 RepID=A0A345Y126_9ACTN|nr:AraC family transcriptional regulator [Streptomyces armeniacus]AXK37592.1 AraC family transcriptional regulator [Streptomyces armeniacus]